MGWHHSTDSDRCMIPRRGTCLPNTRQFGFSCTDASSQQSKANTPPPLRYTIQVLAEATDVAAKK